MTPSPNAEFMVRSHAAASPPEERLPLVVFPRQLTTDPSSAGRAVRGCVDRYLSKLGSILFRGFSVEGEAGLRAFALAAGVAVGASPACAPWAAGRTRPRSTREHALCDCPACGSAALHSASFSARPRQLWLHCQQLPSAGSESLIADNLLVHQRVPAPLRARLGERGLLYVRNFSAPAWAHAFGTRTRQEVESWCRRHDTELEWKADGGLRLLRRGTAVSRHPVTQERLWLNQLHLFHTPLPAWSSRGLPAADRDDLPSNVYYADGSVIEAAIVQEIRAAYAHSSSLVRWEPGDILLLDDLLTAHCHDASASLCVRTAISV